MGKLYLYYIDMGISILFLGYEMLERVVKCKKDLHYISMGAAAILRDIGLSETFSTRSSFLYQCASFCHLVVCALRRRLSKYSRLF